MAYKISLPFMLVRLTITVPCFHVFLFTWFHLTLFLMSRDKVQAEELVGTIELHLQDPSKYEIEFC